MARSILGVARSYDLVHRFLQEKIWPDPPKWSRRTIHLCPRGARALRARAESTPPADLSSRAKRSGVEEPASALLVHRRGSLAAPRTSAPHRFVILSAAERSRRTCGCFCLSPDRSPHSAAGIAHSCCLERTASVRTFPGFGARTRAVEDKKGSSRFAGFAQQRQLYPFLHLSEGSRKPRVNSEDQGPELPDPAAPNLVAPLTARLLERPRS